PGREGPQTRRPNIEDLRAYGEARLAALKAGLALTAEQERNWPAFEQAAREFAKLRVDRANASANTQPSGDVNPAERMNRRATALVETGNALKKLGDATGPLYDSLDENQKRRFAVLSRLGRFGGDDVRGRDGGSGRAGFMRRGEGLADPMMQHPPIGGMQRSMMPPVRGEERL